MIALIVLSGLLTVGILASVATVCWRRRRRRSVHYRRRDYVIGNTGSDVIRRDTVASSPISWTPYYPDHFTRTSSLADVTDEHVNGSVYKPRDLLVADIVGYKTIPFAEEFRQLPKTDDGPTRADETTQSHQFIPGYGGRKRSYVVASAPTDATTAFRYWTVIYQERVTTVVSVGSGTAAVSATAYQPGVGKEWQFGNVSVRTTTVRRLTHVTSVVFQIRRTDDDALPRRVCQYEFTGWPIIDRVMPSTPLTFVEFVEVVRSSSREAQTGASLAPLLVLRPSHDDSGDHNHYVKQLNSYTITTCDE